MSVGTLMGFEPSVPDYSTMRRRPAGLAVTFDNQRVEAAIKSTTHPALVPIVRR